MINSPLIGMRKKELMKEEDLKTIHHNMMVIYGWIPLEEFKKIPLPTLLSLYNDVEKEIRKKEQTRIALLKILGVKNPNGD